MKLFLRPIKISLPWHPSLAICLPNCCEPINQKWIWFCKNKWKTLEREAYSPWNNPWNVLYLTVGCCWRHSLFRANSHEDPQQNLFSGVSTRNSSSPESTACFLLITELILPYAVFTRHTCCRTAHRCLCGWPLVRWSLEQHLFPRN